MRLVSMTVALALLAPASLASAQDEFAEARRHFELAEEHFGAARFGLAIQEYQASYDLMEGHPNRSFQLYNIGRAHEEMGQHRQALEYYRRFLDEAPPTSEFRAETEQRIQNLEIIIDQQPGGGDDVDDGTETASGGGGDLVPAIIGFSVAGAGLAGFAIFGGLALAEDGRIAELPCAAAENCSDAEVSDLRTFTLVADVMIGVAAAGAIAGLILLLTVGMDDGGADESVALAPWLTDTSAGLSAGGTF